MLSALSWDSSRKNSRISSASAKEESSIHTPDSAKMVIRIWNRWKISSGPSNSKVNRRSYAKRNYFSMFLGIVAWAI